jgi:hypothetical protein
MWFDTIQYEYNSIWQMACHSYLQYVVDGIFEPYHEPQAMTPKAGAFDVDSYLKAVVQIP